MNNIDNNKIIILFFLIFLTIILTPLLFGKVLYKGNFKGSFFERYYLADRKVSGIILAITLMSTYGSASTFLSGPGIAYKLGLGWVLLAVIQVTAGYFVLLVLARRFQNIAKKINAITITDYLKYRYKSKILANISAIAMIAFLLAAMSAQWIGGAKLLSALLNIEYKTGILIISIIILFCVVFGGLKNILITDMIQGLIMIFATIILFISIIKFGGGINSIMQNLYNQNPNLLTPYGVDKSLTSIYVSSFWVLVGVGLVGIPQIAINSMLYKNNRSLKQSIIIGTIVIFIVMFGVHFIGVISRGVFPDITDYDSVIPIVTLRMLPWYLVAIVLSAPMAAIITTVNAQFLLVSSTLVKDILLNINLIRNKVTEKKIPLLVYVVNLLIILLAIMLSITPPSLIVEINLFAFGGLEVTFLWPIILGLYWKKAEKYGAFSSTIVGLVSYIIFKRICKITFIEPVVISLFLSFIVFLIISNLCYNRLKDKNFNYGGYK
ncbi:sodium/pantothenate symporter [Gemella sp. GH3]|uniref:sodium/pantothenate symporter n=1 Tax=unclassified Gemella TaxID=2624949 RepID=UPI0015D0318D|nr:MULTISPECIES: sodium/pantothenate symporter [unclassified Gemella]MBF0714321.1 sodium/pantothenate symporter [Gemella sp. GH3.1]NYS51273.1 sodium/pantothenate symporter [Gemella sp. GH3]